MSRPTFQDRWREYGQRPPVARRVARASSLVGLILGLALLFAVALLLILLLAWLGLIVWRHV
jgi:hypothetical protein